MKKFKALLKILFVFCLFFIFSSIHLSNFSYAFAASPWNALFVIAQAATYPVCITNGQQNCAVADPFFAGIKKSNFKVELANQPVAVPGGYYVSTKHSTISAALDDDDLLSSNIARGKDIFGTGGNVLTGELHEYISEQLEEGISSQAKIKIVKYRNGTAGIQVDCACDIGWTMVTCGLADSSTCATDSRCVNKLDYVAGQSAYHMNYISAVINEGICKTATTEIYKACTATCIDFR